MTKVVPTALLLCTLLAAGCGDSYAERAVTGGALGAGAAAATDNDIATGAAIGAGAGIITR